VLVLGFTLASAVLVSVAAAGLVSPELAAGVAALPEEALAVSAPDALDPAALAEA
jgi:hypothetical protein